MQDETDPGRLAALDTILTTLTGSAERTVARITETDEKAAAQVTQGDPLDQDIQGILRKFDAGTYAIPPIFRERLQYHIDQLTHSGNLKLMYARKQRYWPTITERVRCPGPSGGDGLHGLRGVTVRLHRRE